MPRKVKTIGEAYAALKPKEIIHAESAGMEIKRQGEWFFYHLDDKLKESDATFQKHAPLPSADSSSNLHICTRLLKIKKLYFVKGTVRHKSQNGGRGDHRMLKLGAGIWRAVCNTAKGNWSAGGRVD